MAGYGITRQRPAAAKGFAFMTLEDEEGTVNIVIKPNIYERYRQTFNLEPVVIVEGVIQKKDSTLNIIAERLLPFRTGSERQGSISTPSPVTR